jgi:hypothetical protein
MVKRLSIYLGVQVAYLVFIIVLGALAMAKPGILQFEDRPERMVKTPEGTQRGMSEPPSRIETIIRHWRDAWGDEPLPEHIQKKYNVKPDAR